MQRDFQRSSGLKVQLYKDVEAMSSAAARLIASALKQKPNLLLCASAGGTPTKLYEQLAQIRTSQPQSFSQMRVLQIDEWGSLAPDSPSTCKVDLEVKLLRPLRITRDRYVGFRTDAQDPASECERVGRWLIKNGPIDICILGLGLNGHIAMNEPGPSLQTAEHVAKLTSASRKHPMLKGLKKAPRFGYTLGVGDILRSHQVLLLVSGRHKRKVLHKLLTTSEVSTRLPASFLWLHGNAALLCDKDAAGDVKSSMLSWLL